MMKVRGRHTKALAHGGLGARRHAVTDGFYRHIKAQHNTKASVRPLPFLDLKNDESAKNDDYTRIFEKLECQSLH